MSPGLRARTKAFLERSLPAGMLRGSIAEGFLATYAHDGRLELDDEASEMLELCVLESLATAGSAATDAAQYLRDSAALLEAIVAEGRSAGTA